MSELLCMEIYGGFSGCVYMFKRVGGLCVCFCNLSQAVTHWGGW